MSDSRDVQRAVDALSTQLGCPVLVEDPTHAPLWWSVLDTSDDVQRRTILDRTVAPQASALVRRLKLANAVGPVRTPELASVGMSERWCVPLRHGGEHLGYLWVVDPEHRVGEDRLADLESCADLAATVLVRVSVTSHDADRRRAALVDRLLHERDEAAARELIELERLPFDATVVVRSPASTAGWALPDDRSAHVWSPRSPQATSGDPLPVIDLAEAARRAACVDRAVRAGARLAAATWNHLGAWRLVVDADASLRGEDVHPGVAALVNHSRPDLLDTARAMLDNGGDVSAAAVQLHLHRTTLYYRLDRIRELIGVDLREGRERTELHLALWLDAYRRADD